MNTRKLKSEELIEEEAFSQADRNRFPRRSAGTHEVASQKKRRSEKREQLSEDEKSKLINELERHQVEPELQNEELTTDITEQKQSEIALRESEARLNKTESIAHIGSWELNINTGKLIWSDEVYHIYGLQPQDAAATYEAFFETVHPEDRDTIYAAYINSVKQNIDSFEIEHRIILKHTGEIRYIYQKCEHMKDASGKIVRSAGMVQDITERKFAQEEIKRKNGELQKINAEKDKYFSIIAHDLRSPFSGFLGLTEQMANGLPHMTLSEIQGIAMLMLNSATNLFHLLGNLLEWSRMQRGLIRFFPTTFLLKPKISKIMAGSKGVPLVLHYR
jgi:PAS domain S-box-containing protein